MDDMPPGVYELLLTERLKRRLVLLPEDRFEAKQSMLADAEAADRVSRYVAEIVARILSDIPERGRAQAATAIVGSLLEVLEQQPGTRDVEGDRLALGGQVLDAILRRRPDGSAEEPARPRTPLLDTTILTNAPGEPAVAHELATEIPSADGVDIVVAFIRWSGIRGMVGQLQQLSESGRRIRILTTTYTNSTEQRALDELIKIGAEVRISYDTSLTRLHAKAWIFHRNSGFSTSYIGSSNLTHSAQQTGLEWNVRISGARNPDVLAKMSAVFESYWANGDFVPYEPEEFRRRTALDEVRPGAMLQLMELQLRPFQEELVERLQVSRHQGHHRNLLVAATGTGKTVMAAFDYRGLRAALSRSRLLFVAHREEILEQSLQTFRHVVGDRTFGEKWVGNERPSTFAHVFASIQSLNASGISRIEPDQFDVVIVDEFHHAAAPSYRELLNHLQPIELLGLTATPERADGLDVLGFFEGRVSAELRLWDAIDQQHLSPFDYFGIADGADLRNVAWRRGRGYDVTELTQVLTADDMLARRVINQVIQKVADPLTMRALGFCVSVEHARFMAARFSAAGIPAVAIWGETASHERRGALEDLAAGRVAVVFTVDLFNEGVDVPLVDTLLMLRPTESGTLFLQQLGRGLRKARGKPVCTVLDFVGQHRREFRFDKRLRALLGGSRKDVIREVQQGFPFLPAGCQMNLDRVASEIVLESLRNAIPSRWPDKCDELRSLGPRSLVSYLQESGLDLEDIYDGAHSWTDMQRTVGFPTRTEGPNEPALLRAVGRLTHVDDDVRLSAYRQFLLLDRPPRAEDLSAVEIRLLRMLVGPLTSLPRSAGLDEAVAQFWEHDQVRAEMVELLETLPDRIHHVTAPVDAGGGIPLQVHARYSRLEILAALGVGQGGKPPTWQTGAWYDRPSQTDLFAFTLDKSDRGFSPTTRYRDYAISRDLIHWESQSTTTVDGDVGQRYIHHAERGHRIMLFARLRRDERAFWCLGPAKYVSHEGERPISFVWKLDTPLPADLYTSFAAAVA